MWVYSVSKLHRPRISVAFLADTVDTTRLQSSSTSAIPGCSMHCARASL